MSELNGQTGLTWALVVATCDRRASLLRCMDLVLKQTRRPSQIVIVDASDDWQQTRRLVAEMVSASGLETELLYEQAVRRASAAQRNQGIELAWCDVVFLIDDDSMMYGDCAEKIMQIYEADDRQMIAAVGGTAAGLPPDATEQEKQRLQVARPNALVRWWRWLGRMIRTRVLRIHNLFYPYDGRYPAPPIPEQVKPLVSRRTSTIGGYRLTARRVMMARVGFEPLLERYTAGEDLDATYRLSRHGALVNARDAKVCHLKDGTNRLPLYTRTVLHALNIGFLNRLHGQDASKAYRGYRWFLWRRVMVALGEDFSNRRWSLPQVRGLLRALGNLKVIFTKDLNELKQWYPSFQNELMDQGKHSEHE